MKASRDSGTTGAASVAAAPPTPPLLCDQCEWPMGAHEVARAPDGAILGILKCSACVEDTLAAQQLEHQP